MTRTILHIDASARIQGSVSRDLSARIVARLNGKTVIRRDLSQPLPHITEDWVAANFTPADQRTNGQNATLALSGDLVSELVEADTIVIGLPVYNFSIPASLKAWIDLIARAGLTFEYTDTGPRGLLSGKRAIVAFVSGGTQLGSDLDFASDYIHHMLGFVGITEIEFVAADQMAVDPETALTAASSAVERIAA